MKVIVISVVALMAIVGAASAAVAGGRADAYYTVMCDGFAYESVDAHAVEQGHKALAVSLFPRADCILAGPFNT